MHQKWPTMSGKQQITCIHAISLNIKQIAKIEFPAYGSLYFADILMDSACKQPWIHGFCIGPHCGTMYWDCNVGEGRYYDSTRPNRGPYKLPSPYEAAHRSLQDLISPHIVTALLIPVFLEFHLSTLSLTKDRPIMDPLRRIFAC